MVINGKGFGRKRYWPNERYYAGIRLEELRKTTKTSISIAGRRDRDLKLGPPEYEAGVLITRPRRSALFKTEYMPFAQGHFNGCFLS
jgi:hypothetical protein